MSLKTDYKDAIPASGTLRKYKQIDNGDGTYSFQDVTEYSQVGDKAQASVFNGIGEEVNNHIADTNNPHKMTPAQLNLGNVDNTHDADKSVKYAATAGSAPANGGWAQTANYPTHAVGINDFGLRGNYIANWGPSGGADGDTWDQY